MPDKIRVNGKEYLMDLPQDSSLLEFLRSKGFTSPKRGCDTLNCGLCTVWVDGKPVLSCAYAAMRAVGQSVTTIEGVQEEAIILGGHMARYGAEQCGFCSPGFMMAAIAMKRELPACASELQMREYLAGNLCRCSGYTAQMLALAEYMKG